MKDMRIGVHQGTTGADFVTDVLKPTQAGEGLSPNVPAMFTALPAGQIDAAMTDTAYHAGLGRAVERRVRWWSASTPPARPMARSIPRARRTRPTFDKIIQAMIDDGTLTSWRPSIWRAAWGADPTKIPYFKP